MNATKRGVLGTVLCLTIALEAYATTKGYDTAAPRNKSVLLPSQHMSGVEPQTLFEFQYLGEESGFEYFPDEARLALEYAANTILANLFTVDSAIKIKVVAGWKNLSILAKGAPKMYAQDDETAIPVALADVILGSDFGVDDIEIQFDSDVSSLPFDQFGWYFGFDGQPPANQYDFISVALHELIHGLGFTGTLRVGGDGCENNGLQLGCWGLDVTLDLPTDFDRAVHDLTNHRLLDVHPDNSDALGLALQSPTQFLDDRGLFSSIYGDTPVRLYAPSEWEDSVSIFHLDPSEFPLGNPNHLMTPGMLKGEACHHPGQVTLSILEAMRWPMKNDQFRNRFTLTGASSIVQADNFLATREAGEPEHGNQTGGTSVWWEWTPPYSGEAFFDSSASSFSSLIAVYIGETLDTLQSVQDSEGADDLFRFKAAGNTTYFIAVDSVDSQAGNIDLGWNLTMGTSDLRVELAESADPVALGSELVLTATASNLGPHSATDLQFVFELPSELIYVSSLPLGACQVSGANILCNFETLAVSDTQEVSITARAIGTGVTTSRVGVMATEQYPDPAANETTESTTIDRPDSGLCPSFDLTPTIISTAVGGSWSSLSTWLQGRIPVPGDVVEIAGPVRFAGELEVAGLLISQDGWLHERTSSPILNINGNLINHGQIENQQSSRNFSLEISGNVWNTGSISDTGASVSLRAGSCIANSGTWKHDLTELMGTGPRSIVGNPLQGRVTVAGNVELVGDTTLEAVLTLAAGSALEINSPDRLFINSMEFSSAMSTLTGTGALYLGGLRGEMRGDLDNVHFINGSGILGSSNIKMPHIFFEAQDMTLGGGGSNPETINITSSLFVSPGTTVKNLKGRDVTLILMGSLTNEGTISNSLAPNGPRRLTLEVFGPIQNSGTVQHSGSLNFITYSDIANSGTWAPGVTEVAGNGPRVIRSTAALSGDVNVSGNVELLDSSVWNSSLVVLGTLTINSPHVITVGATANSNGWLTGTGALYLGSVRGKLQGDISELRFVSDGNIRANSNIQVPNIYFDAPLTTLGGGGRSPETVFISGNVVVDAGTTVRNDNSRHVTLMLDGSFRNAGTITNGRVPNGPRRLTLNVTGLVENTGAFRHDGALYLHTFSDLANHGLWNPNSTTLDGGDSRGITGASPLMGQVVVLGDFELTSSTTLEALSLGHGAVLALQAPNIITVSQLVSAGALNGNGTVEVGRGGFKGDLSGNLAKLRFHDSGSVHGVLDIPSVIFSSGTSSIHQTAITGNASVLPDATVQNRSRTQRGTLTVEGDLLNEGTLTSRPDGTAVFDIQIEGDFENHGDVQEQANLLMAADILNLGSRTGAGNNSLIWNKAPGSTYQIAFSENQLSWSTPFDLINPEYDISGPLTSSFYWRTRAIDGQGQAQPWSATHAVNEGVVTVTLPDVSFVYFPGSTETLEWSAHFPSSDLMILAMKRDSVSPDVLTPDGVNWFRFTTSTSNDGIEIIQIPESVARADDWRFYVRHAETGAFDASDFTFLVADPLADLIVSINDTPDPAFVGNQITYSIDVSNNGPNDASDVSLTIALLGSATSFVATNQPLICSEMNGVITCELGTISSDSSFPRIEVTVTANEAGTVLTAVDISGVEADPDPLNNTAQAETVIQAASDLAVTMNDSPDPALAGQDVIFTANVTNYGPGDSVEVVSTAIFPAGFTLVATSGCAEDPTGIPTCTLGSIANGDSLSYTLIMGIDAEASGDLTSEICVASATPDPNPGNDCATETTMIVREADLWLQMAPVAGEFYTGSTLTYRFAVVNLGPNRAESVRAAFVIPPELTFHSLSGCVSSEPGSLNCGIGSVNVGETKEFSLHLSLDTPPGQPHSILLGAEVSSDTPDPESLNNVATLEQVLRNRPVVIVPGIMGTHLFHNNDHIWANRSRLAQPGRDDFLDVLEVDSSGDGAQTILTGSILRSGFKIDYYGKLISSLGDIGFVEGSDLVTFPYDWRLDNAKAGSTLGELIRQIRERTGTRAVDLVTHSMGGLVARAVVAEFGHSSVHQVVYIGTPHLGSANAFNALTFDATLNIHFVDISSVNKTTLSELAKSFPSVYQLLPQTPFLQLDDVLLSLEETYVEELEGEPFMATNHLASSREFINLINSDTAILRVPQTVLVGSGTPTLEKVIGSSTDEGDLCWQLLQTTGDGTVSAVSAAAPPGEVQRLYVDGIEHSALPNNESIASLVGSLLLETSIRDDSGELPAGVSEFPTSTAATFGWSTCSPVTVVVTDQDGNRDGVMPDESILREIPRSTFLSFSHGEAGLLPGTGTYNVELTAFESGLFSLFLQDYFDETLESESHFLDVPVAPSSQATVTISESVSNAVMLLDIDGDSVYDFEILGDVSPDPLVYVSSLQEIVRELDLPQGLRQSFLAKLEAAAKLLDRGNRTAARGQLRAFINEVEAQRGRALTTEDVDLLLRIVSRTGLV